MSLTSGSMHGCKGLSQQQQSHKQLSVPVKQAPQRLLKLGAAATDATRLSSSFEGLSQQQLQRFDEDGYLAIPGFASQEQVRGARGLHKEQSSTSSFLSRTVLRTCMHAIWSAANSWFMPPCQGCDCLHQVLEAVLLSCAQATRLLYITLTAYEYVAASALGVASVLHGITPCAAAALCPLSLS
jgi:hypothetical protein